MKKRVLACVLMLTTSMACAAHLDAPIKAHAAQGLVLEVVFFQSKPGVSNQQLLAAAEKINPVLHSSAVSCQ